MRPRGTGSIYQPPNSPYRWAKYYVNGVVFRESTKTSDPDKAERFLRRRLGQLEAGTFTGPSVERVRVAELADALLRDYRTNQRKSLDDTERRWKLHLKKSFGHLRAVQVTTDLIGRYIDQRQQAGAANGTINRELAALRRMFKLGAAASPPKVLRVPKFPKLAERNIRTGFVEDSQYERLHVACSAEGIWLDALFETGCTYGWRLGELLSMRVRQVDLLANVIRLEPGTTKNNEGREVEMTGKVRLLLSECVRGKTPENYVFTRPDGKPVRDFRGVWSRVCREAGVPELLFHDLRRTAARNLRRAGVAEGVIMKIGGWKTRSVFERYAIVSQSDIRDAMAKLQANRNDGHTTGIKPPVKQSATNEARPN